MPQPTYGPDLDVTSRDALAHFILRLREDLIANGDGWENATLESYLEALAAWIEASPAAYRNNGEEMPSQPDWKFLGRALRAAAMYE